MPALTLSPQRRPLAGFIIGRWSRPPILALASCLGLAAAGTLARSEDLLDLEADILEFEDRRISSPQLHSLLEHTSGEVRGRAALALGRIGRVEDVTRLAGLLGDPDAEVRRWAAFALGEVEDSTAAEPLERLLLDRKEPDAEVRELAVEGLGKLRRGEEGCRIALRDREPTVQARALLAAWKIPLRGALPEILQMAGHQHDGLRWTAAYCLMRFLGAPASGRTPIPGGVLLTEEERTQIAETLLPMMNDPSPMVRMQAARGLRNTATASVTNAFISRLEDEDWRVRVEALRGLGAQIADSLGGPRRSPLPPVFAHISDDNPNVGITAIEAMANLTDPLNLVEMRLGELLTHPQPRFRETAFRSLATRLQGVEMDDDHREKLKAQLDGILADRHWSVRTAALDVLDLLSPEQQREMIEVLRNDDPRVAKLSLSAYFRLRSEDSEGPLLGRLQPELDRYLDSADAVLRYSAWDAVREVFVAADAAAASAAGDSAPEGLAANPEGLDPPRPASISEADWTQLEGILQRENARIETDPKFVEVRQEIVVLAALHPEREASRALLERACGDVSYLVRRDAANALRAAGQTPPRDPEPIVTGRTHEAYRDILQWARRDWRVEIDTDGGTLSIRLFAAEAPLTCWNFAKLCQESFYDAGNWHRVVPDFVLQDGCPRGDGWGGPLWQIRCEINRQRYQRGALGMALSGKDTGGSQFFLTHSDQPHLDGGYTVFGTLLSGHVIADQIVQGAPIHRIRVVEG